MKYLQIALLCCLQGVAVWGQQPRTELTKWQDGKLGAVSITYDDSTINQFRIAVPMMNERGLPGTFFIITGEIPGSRFMPTFVGRPIMDIIRESATVPTNKYQRIRTLIHAAVPGRSAARRRRARRLQTEQRRRAHREGAVRAVRRRPRARFVEPARPMPSARNRTCLSAPRKRGARPQCMPEGLRGMRCVRSRSRATRLRITWSLMRICPVSTKRTCCTRR